MKCIVTATIWVQERNSKNYSVEVMTITHNKLFFTSSSHKRSSHLNTTVCNLECSGQKLPRLARRIQAVSLQLFSIPHMTPVLHRQPPLPNKYPPSDGLLMPHILLVKISTVMPQKAELHNTDPNNPWTYSPMSLPPSCLKKLPGCKVQLAKYLSLLVFCCSRVGWPHLSHKLVRQKKMAQGKW